MREAILIGGGGHARVLAAIARRDAACALVGYADVEDRGVRDGLVYLGPDADLAVRYPDHALLLGVGLMLNAAARWRLFCGLRDPGGRFLSLVATTAGVADGVRLGAGSVVLDRAVINPGAVLGEACIVNTGAIVEHDCRLGDNVHVAPGAVVCGGVTVGSHCLIGAGAVLVPGVTVAAGTVVGAGAAVVRDLAPAGTYVGVPAVRRGEGMPG
ncbi:MAG: acetyltransferase [Candidatus Krumholzibacteriia bacterium]